MFARDLAGAFAHDVQVPHQQVEVAILRIYDKINARCVDTSLYDMHILYFLLFTYSTRASQAPRLAGRHIGHVPTECSTHMDLTTHIHADCFVHTCCPHLPPIHPHLPPKTPHTPQNPPKRSDIMAALRAYDEDGNGTLDQKEFEEFARSMINTGPDAFFARVGKHAVIQTAVLPAAAAAVQKAIPNTAVRG